MDKPANGYSKIFLLLLALLSLAGISGVLAITYRYGAGVTPDSAFYLSCAHNILTGKGFTVFTDEPFCHWPPLFPLVLSFLGMTEIPLQVISRFFNAFLFGGILFITGIWLARKTQRFYPKI